MLILAGEAAFCLTTGITSFVNVFSSKGGRVASKADRRGFGEGGQLVVVEEGDREHWLNEELNTSSLLGHSLLVCCKYVCSSPLPLCQATSAIMALESLSFITNIVRDLSSPFFDTKP